MAKQVKGPKGITPFGLLFYYPILNYFVTPSPKNSQNTFFQNLEYDKNHSSTGYWGFVPKDFLSYFF